MKRFRLFTSRHRRHAREASAPTEIDFAAYHFDPHTLLAVLLLCLAIAVLFVTALIPDKQTAMRKGKAFSRVLARMKVKALRRLPRKSKGIK